MLVCLEMIVNVAKSVHVLTDHGSPVGIVTYLNAFIVTKKMAMNGDVIV